MPEAVHREAVYLWYYFDIQLRQIFWYWVLGMLLGSAVSVFIKEDTHNTLRALGGTAAGPVGHFCRQRSGHRLAAVHVWHHPHRRLLLPQRDTG